MSGRMEEEKAAERKEGIRGKGRRKERIGGKEKRLSVRKEGIEVREGRN